MTIEEEILARIVAAMDLAGADVWLAITDEISAAYPPASAPGTPPHKRSGKLQSEVTWRVDPDGTLTMISPTPYAGYLRDGTGAMAARDFMGDDAAARYEPLVYDRLRKAF